LVHCRYKAKGVVFRGFAPTLNVPKDFLCSAKGWVQWRWLLELSGWERWGGGDRQSAQANAPNAADVPGNVGGAPKMAIAADLER